MADIADIFERLSVAWQKAADDASASMNVESGTTLHRSGGGLPQKR